MNRQTTSAPSMNRGLLAGMFALLWVGGMMFAALVGDSKVAMQAYAVLLALASLIPIFNRSVHFPVKLLSAHTVILAAPLWFLYLEAILPSGDAWLLPADSVIIALSYVAFFLCIFNLAYVGKFPSAVVRFHERNFRINLPPNFFPMAGIVFTFSLLFVIWGYYGFSVSRAFEAYMGGRSTGSGGLIKRGGIGGWEVFLQPIAFIAPVVPTLAALSWVRFGQQRRAALPARALLTACAGLLIFIMFLGGSRGNMAVFLAGPAAIWLLFGRRLPKPVFLGVTLVSFLFLIGIWEYQMRKRSNLLKGVSSLQDMVAETSFNPLETHRDNNLYLFTLNTMYMPNPYPFEGYFEFYLMIVNPIPRAIWPGKPKSIQESASTFQNARGPATKGPIRLGTASLSSSIVSDGYEMHHYFGIALYAAILGFLASAWDRIGQHRLFVSKQYFIINAAWLFWMLWSMRAAFAWITGMYSVWGAYLFCYAVSKFAGGSGVRKAADDGQRLMRHRGAESHARHAVPSMVAAKPPVDDRRTDSTA